MKRPAILLGALLSVAAGTAWAQSAPAGVSDDVVKIGVLGDMSGLYSDVSGTGSIEAAKMAVEDFGGKVLGKPVEIIFADHQNKPDIASSIARRWYDNEKVDAIADVVGSASSLAVTFVANERKRVALISNGATAELNGAKCTPYSVQWRSDTYAMARSTAKGILSQGGKTWFIVAADYALGHSFAKDLTDVLNESGGKVVGKVFHPVGTQDFSSFVLAGQTSGADIVAFANAGGDMVNAVKSASDFGLTVSGKQRITGLLVFISDVHSIGLEKVQGLVLESDFYWDMDDRTRAFGERFFKRTGRMPTMTHAANYSVVLNYLKAIEKAGTDNAETVMATLKKMPIDDVFARNAYVREDGLLIHDLYLFQVKSPKESKRPWDYYKQLATIRGEDAFRPLSQSACPLVKKN
ncbi:ABC transporter substrate-binding protein [Xanthobacter tagetidis]|jgi:branched-chain amino acid transport system substrate-binding protein|uniref:ABC transporter substrate-binding protein n=1 Tax=Xanthobacter tagetidis TaxID=60216 RepID=A0A3L7A0I0_9HYPH|nr:ABC transporter substrate-binding protein [Xanthobacter tagetidis]MBB6309520.1 branched-chain amino acid transport system substrate-binding protein [Xanthobacter tagetidis]RLP73627.1 ABC transporter substrate-binding protein [Xanthobacter tagetidis]